MRLKKLNIIGIVFGVIILLINVIFFLNMEDKNLFLFVLGIAVGIITVPFIIQLALENKKDEEIGERFLEFSRNLAESVVTGTPISKSIINM